MSLVIAADAIASVRLVPEDAVVVLRDHTGAACASGWVSGHDHWLRVPGVAAYRFRTGSPDVAAFPEPGAETTRVVTEYEASIAPMALQAAHGYEVLHGSAVLAPGRGVVGFCALSRTGKSTIAYGLGLRGYPPWADDLIALEPPTNGTISTLALPFLHRLTSASRAYFDLSAAERAPRPVQAPEGRREVLHAICLLGRTTGRNLVEIDRLPPSSALAELLPHAYQFLPGAEARKRQMVQRYLELCAQIPLFRIRFPSALDRLPEVLDAIENRVIRRDDA